MGARAHIGRDRPVHVRGGFGCARSCAILAAVLAVAGAVPAGASAAWSRPATLTHAGEDVSTPTIASNGRGVLVVAWYRFVGEAVRVIARTSTSSGQIWSRPQVLGPGLVAHGGTRPAVLRAAVGPGGDATVVWQQATGPNSQKVVGAVARRGRPFGRVRVLSAPGVSAAYPDVGLDAAGRTVVVWATRTQIQRAVLLPSGAVRRRVLRTGIVPDGPTVAVNARGDRLYAWFENTQTGAIAVWAARERADGAFTMPQRLQHQSNGQIPQVDAALVPSGRATVVYEQAVGNASVVWATSAPRGRRFGSGQRLSVAGQLAILGGGGAGSRGVGVDGTGGVSAIWLEDPIVGPGTSRVRVASAGAAGRFGAPRTLQTIHGDNSFERSAIAVAPGGGILAAWTVLPGNPSGASAVWGAAAAGRGGFSRPARLSGADADRSAVAASSPAGAGLAVWDQGQTTASVRASRWTP